MPEVIVLMPIPEGSWLDNIKRVEVTISAVTFDGFIYPFSIILGVRTHALAPSLNLGILKIVSQC